MPDVIAQQAIALAGSLGTGPSETEAAVTDLVAAGDRRALENARAVLVGRITGRSDDFEATGALSLVNKALAVTGHPDPFNWKHRRKP